MEVLKKLEELETYLRLVINNENDGLIKTSFADIPLTGKKIILQNHLACVIFLFHFLKNVKA